MNVVGAWNFNEELNIFQIPIKILNSQTQESRTIICLFDTGFSGYIGLDADTINTLHLPKIGEGYATTANGLMNLQNFAGIAEIINADNTKIGETFNQERELIDPDTKIIPIQKFNIAIMGMKIIKNFHWLMLPDKKMLLMID
jgi:predicted aspartyl protease